MVRPSSGFAPRVGKSEPLTRPARTTSGSPCPVIDISQSNAAPREEKSRVDWRLHSV
jgi:hypothetical protein